MINKELTIKMYRAPLVSSKREYTNESYCREKEVGYYLYTERSNVYIAQTFSNIGRTTFK